MSASWLADKYSSLTLFLAYFLRKSGICNCATNTQPSALKFSEHKTYFNKFCKTVSTSKEQPACMFRESWQAGVGKAVYQRPS